MLYISAVAQVHSHGSAALNVNFHNQIFTIKLIYNIEFQIFVDSPSGDYPILAWQHVKLRWCSCLIL